MTESQKQSLSIALSSLEVQGILTKLNTRLSPVDVELSPGYSHVLQVKASAFQIAVHEKEFAEKICSREKDDVLLLGSTPAIEGFFLRSRRPLQLKRAGVGDIASPPGVFVQAFLTAWQKSRGWRDVWLFISAPRVTVDFVRQRWNSSGTLPRVEQRHINGQISRVVVHCSDGVTELPMQSATGRL